jgi:hypothetical protein
MNHRAALIAVLATLAEPAAAADLRDLCPDRPGRLTPACIVDAGHLLVETGAIDFIHDANATDITDTLTVASTTLRYGLTSHLEAVVAWSPYVSVRDRVRGGAATTARGIGDVLIGVKQSLLHPDGKGVSIALAPFVTIPTAKSAIGAGTSTQGLVVAVNIALPADFSLGLSPEVDRLPNAGDRSHHASYTMVGGISRAFGALTPGVELAATRDDDPTGRRTKATADAFVAWVPKSIPTVQFDVATYVGLNRDTPDIEAYIGILKRF